MTVVTFIYALALIAYLALAVRVLSRRPRTPLHWSCAAVLVAFAVWSAEDIVHGIPSVPMGWVRLAGHVGSLGWGGFASVHLVFALVLTRRLKALRRWPVWVGLGLPVLLTVYAEWAGNINSGYTVTAMGWRTVWSNSFWVWFYYAYYVAFALASLVLVSRFRSTTRVFRERKQADLILGTGIATLLLGTTTDVVIPQLTRLHTPDLAGALCLVWAAGLYVAVTRYGLMSVTAQAAADEILATMADALLLLTPEGKVVAANNGATRLLGRSAAELRDRPAEQFFGAPEQFRQALARVGDEVALTAIELECRGKDGRLTPVSVSSRLMRDRGGETVGSVWVLRDITARRQAEERQSQLLAEVEAANRELNSFAYVVSHDLKAPLRAIDSLVKWLLSDYQDRFDEPGREMVALLIGRVKRMHDLIDGVLQYSRAGRALEESGDVKVATVIADVVAALAPPVHIKVQVEGDFPTVRAAKVKLEQVFQNLLSNAIKYMDKPKGLVRVACTRENGSWRFSVSDNGPGIDRKDFERVFQLFATLKPRDQTESTGVGLSVVKKIVELYGGRVWVESTLGEGSTFHFTLPRMQDA